MLSTSNIPLQTRINRNSWMVETPMNMNKKISLRVAVHLLPVTSAIAVAVALIAATTPTPVYSQTVVGYVNVPLQGTMFFSNPLLNSANDLATLFGTQTPDGTAISLWNPTTRTFDITSQYLEGAWTIDLTLMPGTGARVITPSPFTNTFVGNVLNHNGSLYH